MNRALTIILGALTAAAVVATLSADRDTRPPRIVSAVVEDADGDARADRLRLTYSEPSATPQDADGRYPFAVTGLRIASVGAASGKRDRARAGREAAADRAATARRALRAARRREPVEDAPATRLRCRPSRGSRSSSRPAAAASASSPPPPA